MNSFYYSDNNSDEQRAEGHSVAMSPESIGFAGHTNRISATNGLIVSHHESPDRDQDGDRHELHRADNLLCRILTRISRGAWFSLMRRIFHYQNGREGSDPRSNPLNAGAWICVELVFVVGQILSAAVILLLSRAEKPISPLRLWVVGYALGCCASLPLLYWRYRHRYGDPGDRQGSDPHGNSLRMRYGRGGGIESGASSGGGGDSRIAMFMERCRMLLDFFFAVWFVIGNVWVFGTRRTFSDEAPTLYKLCIVLLALSCVGYALPFLLFAVLCCCMPCLTSFLGYNISFEAKERGASSEAIAALPTHKFRSTSDAQGNAESSDDEDSLSYGGYIVDSAGKKRVLLSEDAECCICLTKYKDNEHLKELPCTHLFHVGCVDQWLEISSSCPLCKRELRESIYEGLGRQIIDI